MEFRKIFDSIPQEFDRWRPRYGKELFDVLIDTAGIVPGKKVLELGPGTGQATDPILATGCDYLGIELGEHLAEFMWLKYGGVSNFRLINDDFITREFEEASFALIYSAATIQWIPEEIAYPKVLKLLKPGGFLAMMYVSAEYKSTDPALYEEIQKGYAKFFHPETPYRQKFHYDRAQEYGFASLERREFFGERVFTAEEFVAFSMTHCDHLVLRPEDKKGWCDHVRRAIEEAGNRLVMKDTYILYLAQKAE